MWPMLIAARLKAVALWRRVRPYALWICAALLAVLTAGLLARKRQRRAPRGSNRDDEHLADALRPALEKRQEEAKAEAEQHKAFAEQRIREAEEKRERIKAMSPDEVLRESEEYARKVRARKGGGVLLALLATLAWPLQAYASEPLPQLLVHPTNGIQGWWVPDDVWRAALADASALADLQDAATRFRAALAAREAESAALRQQLEMERALTQITAAKLAASESQLEQATAWYRSPKFLVPLGIVLGGAAITVPLVMAR